MFTSIPYVAKLQSVDNEIVLWEPKMKEQSPGEVRILDAYFWTIFFILILVAVV